MDANKKYSGMALMDTAFYERVYEWVAKIPAGRVCTYRKIAELAGYAGASREVGLAMSRVQEGTTLPCHRVVNKSGALAPGYAFGGKARQRELLQGEGVAFLDAQTIDMAKHTWPDCSQVEQLAFV